MSNFISRFSDRVDNSLGALYNRITHNPSAAERRAQASQIAEQVDAYKQQTELSKQELNATRDQQVAEKRKINEKQIRSLRNKFRPAGFLNNAASKLGQEAIAGVQTNLGG